MNMEELDPNNVQHDPSEGELSLSEYSYFLSI